MESSNQITSPRAEQARWTRSFVPVALLFMLVFIILAYQSWSGSSVSPASQRISLEDFESQHGLQVRLIGVTGGGGLVDFRLKMTDAEKARQFLQEPANLPVLLIAADGTQMLAADNMDEEIQWDDGGILFMMLPNSEGLIQPKSTVTVKFGNLVLEPIPAQ